MSQTASPVRQSTDTLHAPDSIGALIKSRRTIHDFRRERPPRELVHAALEVARWAPNHHLTEPWHFYHLGPETIRSIVDLNAEIVTAKRGAEAGEAKRERWGKIPGWLVVTCERGPDPVREREDYAACACAIQNFQLVLWGEGVGVKWTTGAVTRDPRFYDLIWVDEQVERVVGLLWYGYAEEVPMTGRKPVEEVLVSLP